jgi:uncharacterized SAM-binding protein YcdF (DUF218 family)
VIESSIIWEDKSSFTKENATFSKLIADEKKMNINKAIICCKSFHARRSLMCYKLAFPTTEFYIHPIPYYEKNTLISKQNWYKTQVGVKRVLGELERCVNDEIIKLID